MPIIKSARGEYSWMSTSVSRRVFLEQQGGPRRVSGAATEVSSGTGLRVHADGCVRRPAGRRGGAANCALQQPNVVR